MCSTCARTYPSTDNKLAMSWKQRLQNHYTGGLDKGFQQFRMGVSLFFVGAVMLYLANQMLSPSLAQELAVLGALTVGGAGFVWAMMGHWRMLIGRLIHFVTRRWRRVRARLSRAMASG